MTDKNTEKFVIELFDPERHDRTTFCCGVEQVDNFFKKTANKLANADNSRIYLMTDAAGHVIGFYALNAHVVDYRDLPKKFTRSRPSHGSISAAFLSMIGVDTRFAGHGYGSDLLVDALMRVTRAAENIGIAVVILDVLNDGNQDLIDHRTVLYTRCGFQSLSSNPLRMFLPVATIRKMMAE